MATNWLPKSSSGQLSMARNWISIVNAPQNPPDRDIPSAEITALCAL
jgi:undecaprenyl pyrophosphate phosphatase UppP